MTDRGDYPSVCDERSRWGVAVTLEHRPDRHPGVSHVAHPNGSSIDSTDAAFVDAAIRAAWVTP